jgi:hypothetical protein
LLGSVGGGKGGGITIEAGGTGAGLESAGGLELGIEIRISRWTAVDLGAGWYRPTLEVFRDRGPGAMVDSRSADVDLTKYTLGLVVTPPKWRSDQFRAAVSAFATRAAISEPPAALGLSVADDDTGFGVDIRAEYRPKKNGRWGIGGALAFASIGPSFVDLETGATGSVQTSALFLRLGIRWNW